MTNGRLLTALAALAAAGLSLGLYSGVLGHGLIWDDAIVVQEQLPYFSGLAPAFRPPAGIPQFMPCYYRPLVLLSYQLDRGWARASAGGAAGTARLARALHRFNLLAHALAAAVVVLLGAALARAAGRGAEAWLPAAGAGLLFAVHPIHVEAVAWIVGRADVLCGLFLAAALQLHLQARARGRPMLGVASAGCALLAMLSKENGVAALALVPALDVALRRRRSGVAEDVAAPGANWRELARGWLALSAAGAVYAALRLAGLSQLAGRCGAEGAWRWDAIPGALGWFVVKAVWPGALAPFVDRAPGAAYTLVGAGLLALLTVAAMSVVRGAVRRLEAWLVLFFAVSLAPSLVVAIRAVLDRPVAERHLYAPSIAVCLALALLMHRLAGAMAPRAARVRAVLALGPALLLAIPAGWAALARMTAFQDDLSFWRAASEAAPESRVPRIHLAAALNNSGQWRAARSLLLPLLDLDLTAEQRGMVATQLGNAAFYEGRLAEAASFYRQSIASNPRQAGASFNWGLVELRLADVAAPGEDRLSHATAGLQRLTEAVNLNPHWARARFELGVALIRAGWPERGRHQLEEALRLAPAGAEAERARALLVGRPTAQSGAAGSQRQPE